jgi:pimeloyl-ACP methyl ester carboxylesterase
MEEPSRPELFPGELDAFPPEEMNWFDFRVQEGENLIQIHTYRKRVENGQPRAILLAVHGLNSAADFMAHIANAAVRHGIETCSMDHRPFGRSTSAKRGNFDSVDTLVEDILSYLHHIQLTYPKLPIFLVGESLGGHISLIVSRMKREEIAGIVLLAPLIHIKNHLVQNPCTKCCFYCFSCMVGCCNAPMPSKNVMFREEKTYEYYQNHPLFYTGPLKFSSAIAMSKSCDKMCTDLAGYTAPMLIF